MLLEKNGKASSSKRTKHINIRYFFITDRVNKGEVSLLWCPTGDMIGDFMTKPLQGALFRKFRDQIMGVVPAKDPGPGKAGPKDDEWKLVESKKKKRKVVDSMAPPKGKGRRHRSVLGEGANDKKKRTKVRRSVKDGRRVVNG